MTTYMLYPVRLYSMAKLPCFLLLLLLSSAAGDGDPTGFVYAGCSQPRYTPGSPYQFNVESLLSSLANSAAFSTFANFTSSAASPSSPVYGLFQCRGDLSVSDCSSCIRSALSRLSSLCPSAAASALQLRSCYIRYGNDSFLGRPDTSLLYKTCSSGISSIAAPNFLGSRDTAFFSLSAGGGLYRVGATGDVQAEAQCVGDLSAGECSNCIAAAASQVKASCGGAASGEAYLGKCDIRYYSNGARPYAYSSGGGGGESSVGSHDDYGKTLAIIIGLLAGVALLIIFLSIIKRTGNGK